MEVKAGYKLTDVGLIPGEWKVSKLGHHASFKTGPFGSTLHKSDYSDGCIPVINPMQIVDGRIKPSSTMAITELAAKKLKDFRLSKGEVIIGRRGDMGRCAFVHPEQDGWLCGTGSMIVRTGSTLDARFLQRVLSSPPVIAAIENASVGSTMINLNQSTLANLLIAIPSSLVEQEAIAEALSDADALIELLEQLLTKKRQIKQGAMQELLTGKKRLPGFSGEWEAKLLDEIADVKTGPFGSSLHERDYVQNGVPIITVEHLGEFSVTHENLPLVGNTDYRRLSAYILELGDIVFSRVGSIDRNALIRQPEVGWLFSGRLLRVRADKNKAIASFLSHLFHSEKFKTRVRNVAVGQTMASLSTQILKNVQVELPKLAEQTAIATILF